ncbi:Retrotransposon gag domain [Arabidopsis thaliana x Arabidopsis arenosa]|uniref:Retrotransposon gag domain n=1 Tax=Arabidopsis thaliana x Arabidopsis arenosa TaxID=1240361 RepID=A0A8T1Z293_9BRAS|nr:Retrotransposon gag domain [Arabidopsis thaliana x Arabidopsis arenosa]
MAKTRSQAPIKETVVREATAVVRETVADMWFRSRSRYADPERLETVDFPRFHGDKILDWLFQIEQFFLIDRTPEELKVDIASIHFDNIVATLHQSIVQSMWWKHVRHDWWSYKLLLQVRYNKHVDDSIAKLKLLEETEGIEVYHARFESISTRVKLDEDYLVSLYLTGLENDTQVNVKMFQPQTIQQCFLIGKLYERAHPKKNNVNTWSGAKWSGSASQSKGILSSKPEPDHKTVLLTSMERPKDTTTQPHKVLSTKDMSKQRDQKLCYFGDEKYKNPRFGAEEDGGELEEVHAKKVELEETGVIAHISVKAVSGVSDYRMMRVKGSYENQVLYIIIDLDSTHNFMDPKVAEKLKCDLKPASMARVSVADGRMLRVDAKIDRFQWEFRGTQFQADLMVIPLRGCDMVLGVQWMETLGPITCDFKKLEMQFRLGHKKVLLQGIRQGSVRDVKALKLIKLREDQVQPSMICVHEVPTEKPMLMCSLEAKQQSSQGGSEGDNLVAVLLQQQEWICEQQHEAIYATEALLETDSVSGLESESIESKMETSCVAQPQVSIFVMESSHQHKLLGDFDMHMVISDQQLVVADSLSPLFDDFHSAVAEFCEQSTCDKSHKRKRRLSPKSWMFKFRMSSKPAGTSHFRRHKESGLYAQIRVVKMQSKHLLLSLCPSFVWQAMIRVTVKRRKVPKTWSFKYKQQGTFGLQDVLVKEPERTS